MTDSELAAVPDTTIVAPLSEMARRERRTLFLIAVVVAATAFGGVAPTKFEQLGLVFQPKHIQFIQWLLVAVLFYFVVAYTLYSRVERIAWERALDDWRYLNERSYQ